MRYKKFEDHIVAIMETGESIIDGLTELCEKEQIGHGMVTGIGGTKYLRLGVWDRFENCYKYIEKDRGSMEILSLKGNISRKDGAPNLHLHVTASDDSFNAFGGHLDRGIVQNMLEVYVYPYPEAIERKPYQYWFFMDI
ncbi:MAG: DNA-binding protein [Clostridia bacterium]|nr:DNA-binding protein [Clostridia bacterium]